MILNKLSKFFFSPHKNRSPFRGPGQFTTLCFYSWLIITCAPVKRLGNSDLPLKEAMKPDGLIVHEWEGNPLTKEHGGPVRMITPQLYAWKGAKWIVEIVFRDYDELGFWEKRGYSNSAEPWLNDRYS